MNIIAHLQGEEPTDRPAGVDPSLRALAIFANDHLDFGPRQTLLIPLVARLMNTRTNDFYVLHGRLHCLMVLERALAMPDPVSGFVEHMGAGLAQRIACITEQIVNAADHMSTLGREAKVCALIVAALEDMLPASELSATQSDEMQALGHTAAAFKGRKPTMPPPRWLVVNMDEIHARVLAMLAIDKAKVMAMLVAADVEVVA